MNQTPEIIPNHLRCIRNDGRHWRCGRVVSEGTKFCQNHHLQLHRYSHKKAPKTLRHIITSSYKKRRKKKKNTHTPFFHKGEEVEITSQELGFYDSWYIATVIQPPKKKRYPYHYLIEYHTFMEEEGSDKRLREFVHVGNMRPLQPPEGVRVFEENEEVDAYYNDGWWQGVVLRVLEEEEEEEEKRYLIFFPNTKEEIEFGQAKVRTHMEWVDKTWVRSQDKLLGNDGMFLFAERNGANQSVYTLKGCSDQVYGHYVGAVGAPRSYCDVVYYTSIGCTVMQKAEVTQQNQGEVERLTGSCRTAVSAEMNIQVSQTLESLEQIPPSSSRNLHQKMDKSNNTDVPLGKSKFKLTSHVSSGEVVELHKRSKKGAAITTPMTIKACQERRAIAGRYLGVDANLNFAWSTPRAKRSKSNHKRGRSSVSLIQGYISDDHVTSSFPEGLPDDTIVPTEPAERLNYTAEEHVPLRRGRGRPKGTGSSKKASVEDKGRKMLRKVVPRDQEHSRSGKETPKASASTPSRKRGRSKATDSSRKRKGPELGASTKKVATNMVPVECGELSIHREGQGFLQSGFVENMEENRENCFTTNIATAAEDAMMVEIQEVGNPSDAIVCLSKQGEHISFDERGDKAHKSVQFLQHNGGEDSSPPMMLGRSVSPPTTERTGVPSEPHFVANEVIATENVLTEDMHDAWNLLSAVEHNTTRGGEQNELAPYSLVAATSEFSPSPRCGTEGAVPGGLPFVSPLFSSGGKEVESKIPDKSTPQRPHFRSLEKENKFVRVVKIKASWALYDALSKAMLEMTVDEPQSSLESLVETLHGLEENGFDVHPTRSRIQELLKLKAEYNQLKNGSLVTERGLIEEKLKDERRQAEIIELNEKIARLNEKRQSQMKEKQAGGSSIAKSEKEMDEFKQKMQAARLEFEHLAKAPL